jgi:hypothetical protein
LRQLHERSAIVNYQPKLIARLRPAVYSAGVALSPNRKGPLSFSM